MTDDLPADFDAADFRPVHRPEPTVLAQGQVTGTRPPRTMPASEADFNPPPSKGRVTVVHRVMCQQVGENPFPIETGFARWLETDEQPVGRTCKVGEEWTPLYHGWLESAGILIVVNEEGRRLAVVPTAEEAKEIDEKIVEVGISSPYMGKEFIQPFTTIPPRGEDMRINPIDLTRLRLRCRKGTARVTISLIPR